MQVTVFEPTDEGGLDTAILKGLYHHKKEMDLDDRRTQMSLALAWNRIDYVQKEVLNTKNPDYPKVRSI